MSVENFYEKSNSGKNAVTSRIFFYQYNIDEDFTC